MAIRSQPAAYPPVKGPVRGKVPIRPLIAIIGVGAAVILVLLGIGSMLGARNDNFRTSQPITATPLRPTPSTSSSSRPDWTPVQSAYREDAFIARISSDGYPVNDRDRLIAGAQQVCAMVNAGQTPFYAAKTLKIRYGYGSLQAQRIGTAALQVYCPEVQP